MDDRITNNPASLKIRHYAAKYIVFEEGEAGNAAYIIRSGKVSTDSTNQSNNTQRWAVLGKGDIFGEMALFDDRPRMASATALTPVEAIRMSKEEFLERLASTDPAIMGMVLAMVTRVRNMTDEFMRQKE